MLNRLITILLLSIPLSAWPQVNISGKVVDTDNKPVAFSTIQLLTSDSILVKTDLSKVDGVFSLTLNPGKYIFKILQFGKVLHRENFNLIENINLGIIIVNNVKELGVVNIQGQKPVIQQEDNKLTFNVVNSPLKKGYNGLDVLARTPKLQVNSNGEVLLRNASPTIYINGRKQNLSGQELVNYLTSLNAEMIKSIEIQTGGSAENDASTNGGVVNIVLKKSLMSFSSTLTSSYIYRKGNIWSGYTGINNNYGSDKWNFYSKIDYRKDNDYGNYTTQKDFFNTGGINAATGTFIGNKNNMNLLGGLVFYPNKKNEFGIEAYYNHSKGKYSTVEDLQVYNPTLYSISNNDRNEDFKTNLWYATLNYIYKKDSLGSTVRFIGDIGRNLSNTNNSTNIVYNYGSFPNNQTYYLINPLSNYYTLQVDWTQKYKNNLQFRTGLKFGHITRSNQLETTINQPPNPIFTEEQENFNNRENISAGYITFSGGIKSKHRYKFGLRGEYTNDEGLNLLNNQTVSQHYIGLFPSLYYGYSLSQNKTLSISYSRSINRPSFRDLNPFITKENDYSYITGNPDLKPQYTNRVDISYQLTKQSLSLYGNITNDFIAGVYSNQGNITYYKPENFGQSKQVGIDYNYYSNLTKWLYANISAGPYYYIFHMGQLQPSRLAFNSNIYTNLKLSKTWSIDVTNTFNTRFQNYVVTAAPQYLLNLSLQKQLWTGKGLIKVLWNDVLNTQRDKSISTYDNFTLNFYQKRRTQSYGLTFVYNFSTTKKAKDKSVISGNEFRNRL